MFVAVILLQCSTATASPMNTETTASFAHKLVDRTFGEFFIYPMHDQTIDRIWADPENRPLLDSVLADTSISSEAKFLAAEVFFKKDILFMQRHAPEKVAAIYVEALKNNWTGMANSWGLMYKHEDEGPVGIAFLTIGEKAITPLSGLLDDETILQYQGSREATVGNAYRYRVKDAAAYYIGRILGAPLVYYPEISDRDAQIDRLREKLGAR